jgi:RsiW-degrading membrane proteinase PrsW (M82 family)
LAARLSRNLGITPLTKPGGASPPTHLKKPGHRGETGLSKLADEPATKLKNALDETRLLILGAQVLFGFQFNGMFQEAFADLHVAFRLTACAGLVMIMTVIVLMLLWYAYPVWRRVNPGT